MKDLAEKAYPAEYLGQPELVIDDEVLLEWARENGATPREAQLQALRSRIIPLRYLKNFRAMSFPEQVRLAESRALVCGCGGLGGVLVNLLARAGVGRLRLADGDSFVPSNQNRQWLCDTQQLFRPKAAVAEERVRIINPLIEVETFPGRVDAHNVHHLAQGVDVILDGLDNLEGRFILAQAARQLDIPFIHAAVAGWWGQISTFLPGSGLDLESIYGPRRSKDPTEDSIGVLGATASVIGSLEAFEALRLLSGRKPAYADRLLYFDGETGSTEIIPLGGA